MKNTPILNLLLLFILVSGNYSFAQKIEKMDFPELGISYYVPKGWVGKQAASGFFMTSTTTKGFILVLSHHVQHLSEMQQEAANGFKIGTSTHLKPVNAIEKIMDNTIAGIYTGTIDTKPAKALIVGMINPYGKGLTILSAANADEYSDALKNAGLMVTASVRFYESLSATQSEPIVTKREASAWAEKLKNCRLTYIASYTSNGGGYGKKIKIDLCGQGYFKHSSYNSMGVDAGSASGGYGSNNKGAGHWKTYVNSNGQEVLQLQFYGGEIYEYIITTDEDDKTFLNGDRYFRTYKDAGKYSPQCD